MRRAVETTAALGGLLFPFLAIGGLLLALPALPPDFSGPPPDIAQFLAANPPTVTTWVGLALELAGLVALLAFGVRLAFAVAADWTAFTAGGLLVAAVAVKLASIGPVLVALNHGADLSAESLAVLFRLNDAAVPLSDTLQACFVLAAGGAILASRLVPRWLGWFALGSAPATLADLALDTGWLSLPLLVWFMTASVALALRIRHAHPTAEPAYPATSTA
jgi:hypothetical protein